MKDPKVSVALCTFNGSQFLHDQLMSIAAQSYLPHELVISDEASTDSTLEIIKSFTETAPFTVNLYQNREKKGVVANYSDTISCCKGDYVALCDQDDLWLPDKLASSLHKINDAEKTYGIKTPLLVYTDLSVIDASGTIIMPSFMKLRKLEPIFEEPLKTLLVQNYVTGCSVLINRALIDVALPIPKDAVMHDWWLALVAAAIGQIIFEPRANILYRHHGQNVIGAKGYYSRENFRRLCKLRNLEIEIADTIIQAIALRDLLSDINDLNDFIWLDEFLCNILQGGIQAVLATYRHNVKKQGLIRNTLFKLILLKSGYVNCLTLARCK